MRSVLHTLLRIALLCLLAAAAPARAGIDLVGDDTDLFTTNPSISSQVPNVLIILDNTSNWSAADQRWPSTVDPACTAAGFSSKSDKQGDAEVCALYLVVKDLDEQIAVGLMMFNDQDEGAYVRFPMKQMNATNKAAFLSVLLGISTNNPADKTSSNSSFDNPMNDAFRYFNSLATMGGAADAPADASAYTSSAKTAFQFLAGSSSSTCGYDYIVFIGNAFPNSVNLSPAIDNAAALLNDSANITIDKTVLNTTGVNTDIWAKFMFQYGVKVAAGVYKHITTYTLDVCNEQCQDDQATLLTSMATVTQGKYFRVKTFTAIKTALQTVFSEVQAVNSVFAATTLPVSINVRGTNLNQVYIGVFRPDSALSPRWLGNLKQYKLGVVSGSTTGQLQLVDDDNVQAVNLNTGFITNTATSIWTQRDGAVADTSNSILTDGFWAFRGTYAQTDVGKDEDKPDGDLVEKGGAAQKIRQVYPFPDSTTAMTRNIYTCTGTCGTATTATRTLSNYLFNDLNTDITAAKLGTFIGTKITSLTGIGSIATATTESVHGFSTTGTVIVTGASPNLYNGTFTPLTAAGNTFTYSIAPNTFDTTHAYATYTTTVSPANAVNINAGDTVTVSGVAAPDAGYNVTAATPSAVSGASNQFSYTLGAATTAAASGYAVTANRKATSLVWTSGVITATMPSAHGYSSANSVVISGATGADASIFNGTYTITSVPSTTSFTYNNAAVPASLATTIGVVTLNGAIPAAWGTGPSVIVCGLTGGDASYNTTAANCTTGAGITATVCTSSNCPGVTPDPAATPLGNYFTYSTNAAVAAPAGTLAGATIQRVVPNDTSTWAVSSAATITSSVNQGSTWSVTGVSVVTFGANKNLRLTLTQGKYTSGASAALRKLTAGDTLTFSGTCTLRVNNVNKTCSDYPTISSVSGDSSVVTGGASTAYANLTGTVTVDLLVNGDISTAGGNAPAINAASTTMIYTGTNNIPNLLRFTLSRAKYSGQNLRALTTADALSFSNCTYVAAGVTYYCNGTTNSTTTVTPFAVSGTSSTTASDPGAGNYADVSGTVTVDIKPSNIGDVTSLSAVTTALGATVTGSAATMAWTGSTYSSAITTATSPGIASIGVGSASATATGTIFASKTGDLTSLVRSISSQANATTTGTMYASNTATADPDELKNLINWVRGHDNKDNENKNGISTDVRAGVHGDVLHSRPAVVNYNRNSTSTVTDDNDVYIFYGSNDGMLRAIKGGSAATGGGKEQWAFVAPEFFSKLKRQRDQIPVISSANPRDYSFDGPISVYTLDANGDGKYVAADGDKVYLFIGMRRGGRMYYALDVSDPTAPKLLWKKGCREATGSGTAVGSGECDAGFGEIGQSWSQPFVGYFKKWPSTLAIAFAAGFDKAVEDPQPCFITNWSSTSVQYKASATVPTPMNATNCANGTATGTATTATRSMGRGVFILNATDGSILWRAGPDASATKQVTGMNYSMAGDLAVFRNRANTASRASSPGTENVITGHPDRIYAADTGGNVWRIDVSDDAGPGTIGGVACDPCYPVNKLASIAVAPVSGSHAALNYRKFLFSPDVVYSSDTVGDYDAVLLGSGDREHAFDQIVNNRFYMFKDRNTGTLTAESVTAIVDTSSSTDLFDVTNNCLGSAANCSAGQTQAQATTDLRDSKGWKLVLSTTGEKTIATATTAAGTVIFNTNEPKQDTVSGTLAQCVSDLGTARQYGISYKDATASLIFNTLPTQYVPTGGRYAMFAGGGFLPTPVPVVVQIDGKYYQTVIAGVQTTNPGGLKLQSRVRTYWYRKTD